MSVKALPVIYAPVALQDLDVVWDRNEKIYGRDHAGWYVDLLQRQIDCLGTGHPRGNVVESRPELRYIRIGVRRRGHCHVAVYRIDEDAVNVLHIFHTAQDWLTRFASEDPNR